MQNCRCPNPISALECLVSIYLWKSKANEDHSSSFLRGHLAVLFGLIMEGGDDNQSALLALLPGSSTRAKLNSLAEHAREFAVYYARLTSELAKENKETPPGSDDICVSSPRRSLERIMQPGTGENVSRNVVAFLETLRDRYP
jgi:hypothetical protein